MSEILVGIDTIRETERYDPKLKEIERARIDRDYYAYKLSRPWKRFWWYVLAVGLALLVGLIVRNW